MKVAAAAVLLAGSFAGAAFAQPTTPPPSSPELTEQAIDTADFDGWRARVDGRTKAAEAQKAEAGKPKKKTKKPAKPAPVADKDPPDPFLIRVQTLLDRAHASPGVIDGRDGDNTKKAVRAFETMRGLPVDGEIDPQFWAALAADGGKTTVVYEITQEDVDGRYVKDMPADYAKLAKLKWLGYRDAVEMLAERFHLDEPLVRAMNPGVDFAKAGQKVLGLETGEAPVGKVARIEIDKDGGALRGFDGDGKLLVFDPATVGSDDTPSPTGKMRVNGTFPNPEYHYDPKKNFKQGRNNRKLTLPGGPNGPVGIMWIDLSKPTYGIHGTPEPSKIDKTGSHGCVRLTNWDAQALAPLVDKKTTVEFD